MNEEAIGEKMAALWGHENLRTIPAKMLNGLTLSDAERRLLTEYGLPVFWGGPLGIEADSSVLGAGFVLDRQRAGAVNDKWNDLVSTNLARFAACLVLHRTLLAEGAALSRRFDSGDAPMPEPIKAEYRAAMVTLMDDAERELREADPAAFKTAEDTRRFLIEEMGYCDCAGEGPIVFLRDSLRILETRLKSARGDPAPFHTLTQQFIRQVDPFGEAERANGAGGGPWLVMFWQQKGLLWHNRNLSDCVLSLKGQYLLAALDRLLADA